MIVNNTPIEHYPELGLWVKREDLSCPPPGPPFSKTRGVYAHVEKRPEKYIGVLDTFHSQAGHAVAAACSLLGKTCINFYPKFKKDRGLQPQQIAAGDLGAYLHPFQATASWHLYHKARDYMKAFHPSDGYLMPNALKLPETVSETAAEVRRTSFPAGVRTLLAAVSSGTIAAGVIRGLLQTLEAHDVRQVVLHMGYSRNPGVVLGYIQDKVKMPSSWSNLKIIVVDEGYGYADKVTGLIEPPFPCNPYYDRKLLRWWTLDGRDEFGEAILWNIG